MPAILDESHWPAWLGEVEGTLDDFTKMVVEPYPSQLITAYPVSTRVNNVKNDDAALIELAPSGLSPERTRPNGERRIVIAAIPFLQCSA
jgi:SOS response associated peptidase (SRAP)